MIGSFEVANLGVRSLSPPSSAACRGTDRRRSCPTRGDLHLQPIRIGRTPSAKAVTQASVLAVDGLRLSNLHCCGITLVAGVVLSSTGQSAL